MDQQEYNKCEVCGMFPPVCNCNTIDVPGKGTAFKMTLYGWICSKCGASNSPYTDTCPNCRPKPQVTIGITT